MSDQAFNLDHYLATGGEEASKPADFSLDSYLASGGEQGKEALTKPKEEGYLSKWFGGIKKAATQFGDEFAKHPIKSLMGIPRGTVETLVSPVVHTLSDAAAATDNLINKIPGSQYLPAATPNSTFAKQKAMYDADFGNVTDPHTDIGKAESNLVGAVLKPLGDVFSLPGQAASKIAGSMGASAEDQQSIAQQTNAVTNAAMLSYGSRKTNADSVPTEDGAATKSSADIKQKSPSTSDVIEPSPELKSTITKIDEKAPPKFIDEVPVAHNGTQLPQSEQTRRATILKEIGLQDNEVRKSAITGDAKAAATDFQSSKLDNPGGYHLSNVIKNERTALENYSDKLINKTGGTHGVDQTAIMQRGQNILTPLNDLKSYYDKGINSLYQAAHERAGNIQIQTPKTGKILADDSEFLGTVEGESLLKGVRARMKSLGMADKDGNVTPTTVQQAERFKQYLGEQWTPRTSRLIRRLKDSIDDDVLQAAGEDIYSTARSLRASRARVLDDPKGISKIMDSEGPEGINRAVSVEKIPDTITTMPVSQFQHIVKTLNNVPTEIKPQAQAAIAEIKAQFASKLHEVGSKNQTQWNAPAVTKYLNANSARMKALFSPEELSEFATLNDAGHILRFDSSYPGAVAQGHNLAQSSILQGLEHGSSAVGAGIGAAVFGPPGAALGGMGGKVAGSKMASAYAERASLKAAQGRTATLSELLKPKKP